MGGKSENSLAWGAPTGGESGLGSPHGGKVLGKPPRGGKAKKASTGGKSENSAGKPYGGEKWKLFSLGSPNWKHLNMMFSTGFMATKV